MKPLRWLWLLGLALLGLGLAWPQGEAMGQGGERVWIGPLVQDHFPRLTLFVRPLDAEGRFVAGLTPSDFLLYEDDRPVPVLRAVEQYPGAQVVVALAPARAFAVRDNLGVSRYEYIRLQLLSWLQARAGTTLDDLSLVTPAGVLVSHSPDYARLAQALNAYTPSPEAAFTLAPLAQALTLAADPTPRPGMGRVVLFITALPGEANQAHLAQLADQARQAGVAVYPWLVGPSEALDDPAAQTLRDLAATTGGRFTFFSGEETLPQVADLLEPHARTYQVDFLSAARESGPRTLHLRLRTPWGVWEASPLTYDLTVLPPHPVFLDLPTVVERPVPADDPTRDPALRDPRALDLAVAVEFPDGHPRALRRLTLLVDDRPVATRTEPPFDRLTWDLTAYTQSGTHTVLLEAEDALGLVGRSEALGVRFVVPPAPNPVQALAERYSLWVTYGVLALAGAVLLWVILAPGRPHARLRRQAPSTPETAPAPAAGVARLVPLPENGHADPPLLLTAPQVTLGSDPHQADLVVDDPSVAPRHARLWRDEQGRYRLADLGSLAGTWVNYTPLSPRDTAGRVLRPGDIVHLGRKGYRFLTPEVTVLRPEVLPWAGPQKTTPS